MITKCLFPAAGYGTRFLPATKAMPKEMLPILTKPLIQYGVEEAYEAGCTVMATITGRGKRAITDHFDISYELEHQIKGSSKESLLEDIRMLIDNCTFTYTRQNEMKGLGDAIYKGRVLVGESDPFAVILADDLCINPEGPGVLRQMIDLYNKYKCCIVAIMEVPNEEVHKYGVISGHEIEEGVFMVDNMVEKPDNDKAPSNLAIIGRYILTPDIFNVIKKTKPGKNGELQITDALLTQAKEGMVLGFRFKGKRFDCGSVDGFVEATNYFYNLEKQPKPAAALQAEI
jgi:UTP--glucose-1-phosphate uridylyltransferase